MAEPDEQRVTIRMYGQGLGDCFLLSFPRTEEQPGANKRVYVLIDCGVVGGTPGGPERMRRVVADIRDTTHGHIDLLVITHEHWDHLSGFVQAQHEWQQITIGALWTAWTERPGDPLSDVLRSIRDKQTHAVAAAAERALQFGMGDRYSTLISLMSFLSDAAGQGIGFSVAAGVSDAFNFAKSRAQQPHIFCEPGEVRRVPGTAALAYVLGPPRSDSRLRQVDPSVRRETYTERDDPQSRAAAAQALQALDRALSLERMAGGPSEFNALVMPLLHADGLSVNAADAVDRDLLDRSFPFEAMQRVALPIAEQEARNPDTTFAGLESYFDELHHWRTIDQDWLGAAEALALRADHLTNNTSLVLAFELPGTRSILLFAGDAQVGNWLSWDEIPAWRAVDDARAGQPKPDMSDLLSRTVFYKVGHHGSHNATLRAKGLERMRDDGTLTAFVPVSTPVARQLKHWAQMPLDALLEAMSTRTRHRVVLPNGTTWAIGGAAGPAPVSGPDWLEVAPTTLPEVRDRNNTQVEAKVPLWVQVSIDP